MTREEAQKQLILLKEKKAEGTISDDEFREKLRELKAEIEKSIESKAKPEDVPDIGQEAVPEETEANETETNIIAPEPEKENIEQQPETKPEKKPEKKSRKKWLIIGIAALVVVAGVIVYFVAGNQSGSDVPTYDWPSDSSTAQMLPEPEGDITYIFVDDDKGVEYLDANINIGDGSNCKAYIKACREMGFNKSEISARYEGDYQFSAQNKEGWELNIFNYGNDMSIELISPGYRKQLEKEEE